MKTDAELLARFARKGDREALSVLFERHAAFAFRTAYAVLRDPGSAEDAVQEAFLNLVRRAWRYDPARPFQPWLRALVAHAAVDQVRSEKRREVREAGYPAPTPPSEDPAMQAMDRETRNRLQAEVDRLPEELRLPTVLHYQTGCSYAEVAGALGCPEGTVATRLSAARERLRMGLARAGIALASGMPVEEVLGACISHPPPPPTLGASLQALAARAEPEPGERGRFPASHAGSGPWAPAGTALLLLAAAIGAGLALRNLPARPPASPAGPSRPAAPRPLPPGRGHPAPPAPAPAEAPPAVVASPEDAPRAASVAGRVTCRETGLPIHGAEALLVFPIPEDGPPSRQLLMRNGEDFFKASTDAEGRYRFEGVMPGAPFRLHVAAKGFVPHESAAQGELFQALTPGEERKRDMALSRGWGLLANLLGPDGKPVEDVTLMLKSPGGEPLEFRRRPILSESQGSLLPDGRWEIGGLDPERIPLRQATLIVSAPGFLPVRLDGLDRLPLLADRVHLDLALDPGRTVEGSVRGPDRLPLGGAYVMAWPARMEPVAARGEGLLLACEAAPDGKFALEGCPPGETLRLWAKGSTDAHAVAMNESIELPASEASATLILDAAGEVSGRVVDARGQPVAGLEVRGAFEGERQAYGICRRAVTGPDGWYALKGLPRWPGLAVSCPFPQGNGRREGWRDVPVGAQDLVISLPDLPHPGKGEFGDFLKPYPGS